MKGVLKIVGVNDFGIEYPLTKETFNDEEQVNEWVEQNPTKIKHGILVKEVFVPNEEEIVEED